MEYNDLTDEQKAKVDQRVESEYVNSDRDPLKELRAGAEAGTNPESHYYDVSDDSEIAALQAETQKATQNNAAPARPKSERWYLSPGQKPMGDPEQYRNIGGATPMSESERGMPQTTVADDGTRRTRYGVYERITDAKGGNEKWVNTETGEEGVPKSMQMMRDMSAGNVDLWSKRAQFNRLTLEQRNRRRAARDHVMAETLREGWEQLNNGEGDIHKSKDGKTYRVVMYRNDGEDNPVARLNKMNVNMGKKGTMTSLAVAVEVDKDGKAIGKPVIKYGYNNDGGTKATGFRDVNPAEVMNRWADTYAKRTGQSQLEARRAAVQAFGGDKNLAGANPAGWDIAPTAQEIAAEERRKADEKLKLERNKIDNQNAQFYASLGFDRDKLAQTSAQFDKNYDLALKQFDASEKHANAADNIAGRKQDLAEKQFDEQVKQTIRGANREDMKLAYEIVTGLQSAGRQPTTGEILKSMGDKTLEHFYKIPVRDENGQMVLNADGAPVTREPETKQEYDQCTENLVKAVNALRTTAGAGGIRDRYTQIQQMAQGISSGEAPAPVASAVGDMAGGVAGLNNGGAGAKQQTLEAKLRARGIDPATLQTQKDTTTQTNATPPSTQTNAATPATQNDANAEVGAPDANGNRPDTEDLPESKPMTEADRQAEAEERAGAQTKPKPAPQEPKSSNEEVLDRLGFKKNGEYADPEREARFRAYVKASRDADMFGELPRDDNAMRAAFEDYELREQNEAADRERVNARRREFEKQIKKNRRHN